MTAQYPLRRIASGRAFQATGSGQAARRRLAPAGHNFGAIAYQVFSSFFRLERAPVFWRGLAVGLFRYGRCDRPGR